ncbi:MAG TPA: transaldolase family protein [Bryobacteraceae bacterium]
MTYLSWLIDRTPTKWWHDSAEAAELDLAMERGAIGATTNPLLSAAALKTDRALWSADIEEVLARNLPAEQKAEALMRIPVTRTAAKLQGRPGLVCAQVNPVRAGDRECMLSMARRMHAWAPNISVKLPATAAGLDVLEECVAEGISVTATVSFTVPQLVAIAERHRAGSLRARQNGIEPGACCAVIMIGRLDDYLREIAHDTQAPVEESDLRLAGLAVTKRAYALYQERGYEAVLLVAALRGDYHLTELAGADLVMSIHPSYQKNFVTKDLPQEERIGCPVPPEAIERLSVMPEFVRSFEPDGMSPRDFMAFGLTQRTLSQFNESGWKLMEGYR